MTLSPTSSWKRRLKDATVLCALFTFVYYRFFTFSCWVVTTCTNVNIVVFSLCLFFYYFKYHVLWTTKFCKTYVCKYVAALKHSGWFVWRTVDLWLFSLYRKHVFRGFSRASTLQRRHITAHVWRGRESKGGGHGCISRWGHSTSEYPIHPPVLQNFWTFLMFRLTCDQCLCLIFSSKLSLRGCKQEHEGSRVEDVVCRGNHDPDTESPSDTRSVFSARMKRYVTWPWKAFRLKSYFEASKCHCVT